MKKLIFLACILFLVTITGCEVGTQWEDLEFPIMAQVDCDEERKAFVDPAFQEVRTKARFVVKTDLNSIVSTVKFDDIVILPGQSLMFGETEIRLSQTSDTVVVIRPLDLSKETAIPVTYYHRLAFKVEQMVQDNK